MIDPLPQRVFPIKTATACQLKWTWSTVYLNEEKTASCHRTNHHNFDTDRFDFHNTPEKLQDRERMLAGQWPDRGCEYCKNIETAGGQSDRITNLDFSGIHAPPELDLDTSATRVTPRILEIYFDNTCNLKCVYCGSYFSSLWEQENQQHGDFSSSGVRIPAVFQKSNRIEQNVSKLFEWLKHNAKTLTRLNILGGEPLYQPYMEQCLDLFAEYPAPHLEFEFFTNLNTTPERLQARIDKAQALIKQGAIGAFNVVASLDCWGAPQEYARFPLNLSKWQRNFEQLISHDWIRVVIGSTVTPLTVNTLPDLVQYINQWNQHRPSDNPIYHYINSVNAPSYMFIDIFGDLFVDDFDRALRVMPSDTPEQQQVRNYLKGIQSQSANRGVNRSEVLKLHTFLNEMDRRRGTDWAKTFPWLVEPISRILG
jgi:pyruvate-formate lyase-activating enzyme